MGDKGKKRHGSRRDDRSTAEEDERKIAELGLGDAAGKIREERKKRDRDSDG